MLLCTAVFLDSMDLSLMGVALPAIGRDLSLTIGRQFAAVLCLQQVRGYGAPTTGLGIVPMGLAIMVAARLAGRLIGRWGPGRRAALGMLVQAAGILLSLRADADADYAGVLLPALVVHGVLRTRTQVGEAPAPA